MLITNTILKELLYDSRARCCLCLEIPENGAQVDDEVMVAMYHEPLILSDIILGVFPEFEFASHVVCSECVRSTTDAFTFIHKCKTVAHNLNKLLCNLEECLEDEGNDKLINARKVFIAISPRKLECEPYYDKYKKKLHSIEENIERFKNLFSADQTNVTCKLCDIDFRSHRGLKAHVHYNCKRSVDDDNNDTMITIKDYDSDFNGKKTNNVNEDNYKTVSKRGRKRTPLHELTCYQCGKIFKKRYNVRRHIEENCSGTKLGTTKATNVFKYQSKMESDWQTDDNYDTDQDSDNIKSETENNIFKKKIHKLNIARKRLKMESIAICENCGITCASYHGLRKHKEYSCKSNPLVKKRKLINQITKKNNTEIETAVCSECGKVGTVNSIKAHEQTHRNRFVCYKCGKTYKTRLAFDKHTKDGCGKERTQLPTVAICDYCKTGFCKLKTLAIHMRIHSSNRDDYHECSWCKKRFPTPSHLKKHLITHTKEKNFECEVCKDKFVSKMSLVYHTRRKHTGEKPYKCKLCDDAFVCASSRKIHMRVKHRAPGLACKYCDRTFAICHSLAKHRSRHLNPKSRLFLGYKFVENLVAQKSASFPFHYKK